MVGTVIIRGAIIDNPEHMSKIDVIGPKNGIKRMPQRPSIVLDANGNLTSELRPWEVPHLLQVGVGLYLAKPYRTEFGTVRAGLKVFVQYLEEDTGLAELYAEGIEPALTHWGNTLVVRPYSTPDLLECLSIMRATWQVPQHLIQHNAGLVPN